MSLLFGPAWRKDLTRSPENASQVQVRTRANAPAQLEDEASSRAIELREMRDDSSGILSLATWCAEYHQQPDEELNVRAAIQEQLREHSDPRSWLLEECLRV